MEQVHLQDLVKQMLTIEHGPSANKVHESSTAQQYIFSCLRSRHSGNGSEWMESTRNSEVLA